MMISVSPSRRAVMLGAAALATVTPRLAFDAAFANEAVSTEPLDFDAVRRMAYALSATAHRPQRLEPRGVFGDLDYDAYRAIRFKGERRLWAEDAHGFSVDLLPPGFIYRDKVQIAVVENGVARPLAFDPTALDFDPAFFGDAVMKGQDFGSLSWSGLRLRYPINRPETDDEIAVFQGASYFRAVGRQQQYGLSARGLALRTAAPEGEEFPRFTHLWLVRPEPAATSVVVLALLDSPSVAGAFSFEIRPGAETVFDVRSELHPRREVVEYGVAPLTSMYYFGAKDRPAARDYRPAVHDSEGLRSITGAGERIWRPLSNPMRVETSTFVDRNPQGFGLIQRPRSFDHYQDAEARYDLRPSAWVTPAGQWGAGGVRLVEIPTGDEYNDNIVAYWRPDAPLTPTGEDGHRFDYRIAWTGAAADGAPLAKVAATRIGAALADAARYTVAIDFSMDGFALDGIRPLVSASAGEIRSAVLKALPGDPQVRLSMDFAPPAEGAAELRAALVDASGAAASETWLYRMTPP